MLSLSDTDIQDVASLFLSKGYDVAFLVPTKTGLEKSILDAHQSVNTFLKRSEIHDYSTQTQGVIHKIKANYVTDVEMFDVTVSLYRPKTRKGDPRIWVYGLDKLVVAGNLLALIAVRKELYIVNCSNYKSIDNALRNTLPDPVKKINPIAIELLGKLKLISNKGFIPSITNGADNGVGLTIESELGIPPNSNKSPDCKGIELKSSRVDDKGKQRNKNQLFGKTPNWKLSPIGSAKAIISKRGYIDKLGRNAYKNTISGVAPNSQGLYFDIDYANDYLRQMFKGNKVTEHDTTWIIEDLRRALITKHKETFWIKAKT